MKDEQLVRMKCRLGQIEQESASKDHELEVSQKVIAELEVKISQPNELTLPDSTKSEQVQSGTWNIFNRNFF